MPSSPLPTRVRLSVLAFLQYAVWGAYLASMGAYLARAGFGSRIPWFYATQGIVSLFMPAMVGALADRTRKAPLSLALCHLLAALFMALLCVFALRPEPRWHSLYLLYAASQLFFLPTISLSNSVSFSVLESAGEDITRSFPPIRMWGTVGFVAAMWALDAAGWTLTPMQFALSSALSLLTALYVASLPRPSLTARSGGITAGALALLRDRRIALFLTFGALTGFCLHISNAYANPFIHSFSRGAMALSWGVRHSNMLVSLSQVSEAGCMLLVPLCIRRWGMRPVMLTAMLAWSLRFALLPAGNPAGGLWLWALSMALYGVAFVFFNVGGSMHVARLAGTRNPNSAQGLFMAATSGVGASLGMMGAGAVASLFTTSDGGAQISRAGTGGWTAVWLIFSAWALAVATAFALTYRWREVSL